VDSLRRIVEKNSVRNWVHNKVVLEIGIAGKPYPGLTVSKEMRCKCIFSTLWWL